MLKAYLKQAPTLIVIGVTGFAAWPALFPDGPATPARAATKPPPNARRAVAIAGEATRDPFQVARPMVAKILPGAPATSASAVQSTRATRAAALPRLSSDDDKVLQGMRLGGTFVNGLDQVAIIDDKVYSRGESLRKTDGSTLPYAVAEVRRDSVLIRRGRRDFVLGFSDAPRAALARAEAPGPAKGTATGKGAASPLTGAEASTNKVETASRKKDVPAPGRPGGDPIDPASMLLRLLSRLGGGGATNSPIAGLGGTSGSSPGSPTGLEINPTTIQAGLNALMGKGDEIGRGGNSGVTP